MAEQISTVIPYLYFNGRCEEAMSFYQSAIGAEPGMTMRMNEAPEQDGEYQVPEGWGDKIMHGQLMVGNTTIFVSDGNKEGTNFSGFGMMLTAASQDQAHAWFDALATGGQVHMPLSPTFWSPLFGMVEDKFGVVWMVGVMHEGHGE